MAALFNVFIERARSDAAGAAAQLANAIAARYGIDGAEVERRLAIGRFRVKGNVDRATADSFAADLTRLGAIVTVAAVEGVDGEAPAKPAAPVKPAAPPVKAAPPVSLQTPRVVAPPAAPPAAPPPKSAFTSGLAAAASAKESDDPGLGALSGEFPLTLSTLDGADDHQSGARSAAQLPASFGPPAATGAPAAAAPIAPASDTPSGAVDVSIDTDDDPPPRPSAPMFGDAFLPPDAQGQEPELQLAVDTGRRPKRASAPPAAAAPATSAAAPVAPPAPANQPAAAASAPARTDGGWKTHARDPRVRYIAGMVLCGALGLVPAAIVGSIRERSAFADLDGKLQERQSQVLTRDDWDQLDRIRASFAERKRAERQSIAFTSVLLWAAISGGLAYVWFRVIDWDRVLGD